MNTIRLTLAAIVIFFAFPAITQAQGRPGFSGNRSVAGRPQFAGNRGLASRGYAYGRSGYRYGGGRYGGYRHGYRGRSYYAYGPGFGYPYYYYGPTFGLSYSYPVGTYYGSSYYRDDVPTGRIVDEGAGTRRSGSGSRDEESSLAAAVQRELKNRGYYRGAVDGQFGSGSRAALRRFQSREGLPQSGRLDERTLEALDFERN